MCSFVTSNAFAQNGKNKIFCAIKTKLGALNVTYFKVCSSDLTQLYMNYF